MESSIVSSLPLCEEYSFEDSTEEKISFTGPQFILIMKQRHILAFATLLKICKISG